MTACDQGKITNVAILCTVIVLACGTIIAPIVVYHSPEAVDLSDNGNGSQISRAMALLERTRVFLKRTRDGFAGNHCSYFNLNCVPQ